MAVPNEPRTDYDDPPELAGPSATIDNVEVSPAEDQLPTPDLADLGDAS